MATKNDGTIDMLPAPVCEECGGAMEDVTPEETNGLPLQPGERIFQCVECETTLGVVAKAQGAAR